jgi:hypothetical protein
MNNWSLSVPFSYEELSSLSVLFILGGFSAWLSVSQLSV